MKQGWEIKKLGEVCDIICGQDYKSVQDENGQYPIYGTGGIMGYASQYRCPANSVIIGRKGNINSPIYVEQPFWNVDTAFGVVPNKNIIHPQFFYLFCRDYDFSKHDVSVTIPSLRRVDIIQIPVPVPPREEQERIVEELDCLSGVIEKKREQLRELDALAQSIFFQMFGDPITNEKGWEVKTIGDVCKLKSGDSSANNTSEGALPYIKVGDMNMSENVPYITTSSTLVSREENIKGIFPIGTTIFPKRGGAIFTNKKRLTTVEICCDLNTMGVIPMHEVLPLYIYHFFVQIDFGELCNGAAIPQINNLDIAPLKICVPPIDTQQEFADKIEAIEKQKELIKKSISETETLFNARMDYYFN